MSTSQTSPVESPAGNPSWVRPRHRYVFRLLSPVFALVTRLRYQVSAERFTPDGPGPYLILYNHQTPFDQFFLMMSFPFPVYYVATEDIFSKGWLSSVLRYLVAPIPIRKQKTDLAALSAIARVAREGGSIAIAPEGNRTFSGRTEHMSPAIALLARRLGLPVVLYRIEGGYGANPRWSDGVRRGPVRAFPARVISPEEIRKLSGEELFNLIREGLSVSEAAPGGPYVSDRRAEYLERMLYVCPFCGLSVFRSRGNEVECLSCRRKTEYREDRSLRGVGFDSPFSFAADWYDYQTRFVAGLDLSGYLSSPMFEDAARLFEVREFRKKILLERDQPLRLFGDRLTLGDGAGARGFPFREIGGMAVIGRNRLNFYVADRTFQLRGDRRFNALKYVNLYYHFVNTEKGDPHGEFLGL